MKEATARVSHGRNKIKMTFDDKLFHVIAYIVFSLLVLMCVFPFYYLLICTVSNNSMVAAGKITFYPVDVHFNNYVTIFQLDNLLNSAKVSVLNTFFHTLFALITTSYMGYFFTKQNMWKRKIWYRLCIVTMYFSAGLIPGYLNIRMLGLVNKWWVYVIPGCLSAYNMVLVKTFIESLPISLEESAEIDGASYMTRYLRIVLPLSKPILATIALFVAVSTWNDFFTTKLYITNTKLYTLQFLLYEYLQQITMTTNSLDESAMEALDSMYKANAASVRLTMTAVVTVPVMCVYPFIQKYYVKGIMLGAIKG